jgi:aerobic carbon-monoxide dehydrogenase medium subunit
MYAFRYSCPTTLAEVVAEIKAEPDAKLLAGGQTLLPSLKLRLSSPSQLVDLRGVKELRGISATGNTIVIAAMTRHAEIAGHAGLLARFPVLSALAEGIGDPMVRNMGTIGGSVANSDPAADYPAALLALDAIVVTTERRIAASDYFLGLFETALRPGEIVVALELPVPERAAYLKFRHPASRFAMVGVFVAQTQAGARVAVTGAGPCVFRVPEMEAALTRKFAADSVKGISVAADTLSSDMHASAAYRAHLIPVLAGRAVAAALA